MGFLDKFLGDPNEKVLKELQNKVEQINDLETKFESFSDANFKERTKELKQRIAKKETLDDILAEAFALVREAAKRALNQRHYDAQLMGGMALHQGKIA